MKITKKILIVITLIIAILLSIFIIYDKAAKASKEYYQNKIEKHNT